MMDELAIAFSEEEIYLIDLEEPESKNITQKILENPHEMTTYNWKENARAMMWWLEHAS